MENIEILIKSRIQKLKPLSEKTIGIYIAAVWMAISTLGALGGMTYFSDFQISLQAKVLSLVVPTALYAASTYYLINFRKFAFPITAFAFLIPILISSVLFHIFLTSSVVSGFVVLGLIYWNRDALA